MSCGLTRVGERAPTVDFYVEQGSDFERWFQDLGSNGEPISLDEWSEVIGQVRRGEEESAEVAFTISLTIDKPEKKIYVSIPAETTIGLEVGPSPKDEASIFYYDFVAVRAGRPKRIQQGKVFIHRDITRPE